MTRKEKTAYIATRKHELVERYGCCQCRKGQVLPAITGFEKYWCEDIIGREVPYDPRRFVFKYAEPRDSDVPVSNLSRFKTTTKTTIEDALARCVILCRSCSDPRRTRKDDSQCQKKSGTNSSLPGL